MSERSIRDFRSGGNRRGRRGRWRYPALSACLAEGRGPTEAELGVVAERIWRELGLDRADRGVRRPGNVRARVLAAARCALEGEGAGPPRTPPPHTSPLVPRGH